MDEEIKQKLELLQQAIEKQEAIGRAERLNAENAYKQLLVALADLRHAKPEERGELSRRYAVTITELEKVTAYFGVYVIEAFNTKNQREDK